jgi:hypothetical protein
MRPTTLGKMVVENPARQMGEGGGGTFIGLWTENLAKSCTLCLWNESERTENLPHIGILPRKALPSPLPLPLPFALIEVRQYHLISLTWLDICFSFFSVCEPQDHFLVLSVVWSSAFWGFQYCGLSLGPGN